MVGTSSSINDDGLDYAIGFFDQIDDLLLDEFVFLDNALVDMGSEEANRNNSVLRPPPPPPAAGAGMLWLSSNADDTIVVDVVSGMQFDDDAGFGCVFRSSSSNNSNSNPSCFINTTSSDVLQDHLLPVVSYEDIVQLEWLSSFVEDSFSATSATGSVGVGLPLDKGNGCCNSSFTNNFTHTHSQFLSSSPVEIETNSSSSCCSITPRSTPMPLSYGKRARSKRPRPTTITPRPTAMPHPVSSAAASETEGTVAESRPSNKAAVAVSKPLEAKITKTILPSCKLMQEEITMMNRGASADSLQQSTVIRKCLHCEITKTPQWRTGPLGPKTLCNACGVRYKSGRLFPEYRPSGSPTFVPFLHSNSHRKVLEMRSRNATACQINMKHAALDTSSNKQHAACSF